MTPSSLCGLLVIAFVSPQPLFFSGTAAPTPSYTATRLPPATRTATPAPCPGDIDADGHVRVDEVIRVIRAAIDGCP